MDRRISLDPRAWNVDVLLTESERKELERLSRETGKTLSDVIRTALREYAAAREQVAA